MIDNLVKALPAAVAALIAASLPGPNRYPGLGST